MSHILHLTLKRQWFDKIASGEKTEEYRDIKPYWISRFQAWGNAFDESRDFCFIEFKNGYGNNAPMMQVELIGINIGQGKIEWGAELGKEYFVIKLGKILTIKNYKPIKTIQ